jgi:hypothetical protein
MEARLRLIPVPFALVLYVIALAALQATSAWAQKSTLAPGESVATGQYLQSPNKAYTAWQQADGNFCVYYLKRMPGAPAKPATGSPGMLGGNVGQEIGNAVAAAAERVLWCHNKTSAGGQFVTTLQNGNLCTYRGTAAQHQGDPTWCSNTAGSKGNVVRLQDDGNLCLRRPPENKPDTMVESRTNVWCHNTNVAVHDKGPPQPPPRGHIASNGAHGFEFEVYNKSPNSVWVTFYDLSNGKHIVGADCAQPGGSVQIFADRGFAGMGHYWVRGELTKSANCQQPVGCDTDTSFGEDVFNAGSGKLNNMYFHSSPQSCWFERTF